MPKVFTSKTQKIGQLGEEIACKFLQNTGFKIIERNYTRKYGEIDVIAMKDNVVRFIEVKSIVVANLSDVTHVTKIRPEENLTFFKYQKISRTVGSYLSYKNYLEDQKWQIDLLCVAIDMNQRVGKVSVIENITF